MAVDEHQDEDLGKYDRRHKMSEREKKRNKHTNHGNDDIRYCFFELACSHAMQGRCNSKLP